MKDAEIIANIRKHISLTEAETELFFSYFSYQKVRKNQMVVKANMGDSPFMLLKSGCLMTYFSSTDDIKHVLQFATAMWWSGDLRAFGQNCSSTYSIKAMLPSELYTITQHNFNRLLEELPVLERYFRIIFQNSLVSHQKRILNNIALSAEDRYVDFQQGFPGLELIIPQKYIASYLGITPEFLSKIRNRK